MFSKRGALPGSRSWDRAFMEKLRSDLSRAGFSRAGFSDIAIKLPHNLVGMENSEVPIQEFLDRERNYSSVIFVAQNEATDETIKILFVNISSTAFFVDDTFPSGHSEPAQLCVQSPDPAKTYSLFHFFYEYLKEESEFLGFSMSLLGIFSFLFISAEFLSLIAARRTLFQPTGQFGVLMDLIGITAAIVILYRLFVTPQGLLVKEREIRISSYVNRALRGELRDNPIAIIIIAVITQIIVAAVLKVLGLV